MQLIVMKCPACGANVNFNNEQSFFKCSYCQNQISVIKPVNVNNIIEGISEIEQTKYTNYLSILEQSMKAGNYLEAYNYCNKALEINPKSGSLWENKAICSFWLSTLDSIANDKAIEIITYLNASKLNEPNSQTYSEVAVSIADNLYLIANYKYNIVPTEIVYGKVGYSNNGLKKFAECICLLENCYQIFPRIEYLKNIIDLIVRGKIKWLSLYNGIITNVVNPSVINFDAKYKYENTINQIKILEPSYKSPF